MIDHLFVFVAMIFTDFAWAHYTKSIADGRLIAGPMWAVAILGFGAFVTVKYVNDITFLPTAMIGAFIGTWLSIWWKKRAN